MTIEKGTGIRGLRFFKSLGKVWLPAALAIFWCLTSSTDAENIQTFSIVECGSSSCSPQQCEKNTEPDCEFNTKVPDFATEVASLGCKMCTQSTGGHCQKLSETFRVADGHVKAAWCNDKYMVVAAESLPAYDAAEALQGIPLPPGGDAVCRVRTAAPQLNVFKVPLNPTAVDGVNSVPTPLPNVPGMPEAGATAVAVDGVPIFPNYNNRGMFAWESCELDRCNAHSGKGEDYHYHGDPFGDGCMYGEADYAGTHPPLIGFALDGFLIYGRYTGDGQDGQEVQLDRCGAHSHGDMEYHYHPQVEEVTTADLDGTVLSGTITYTAYKGAPMECWGGDIDSIDNFYVSGGAQANYDSTKGGLCSRNDLEDLRPCCGMESFYTAPGVTPVTSAADGSSESPACNDSTGSSSTAGGTEGTIGTCEGTDDQGKTCPPDFSDEKPCPPGCTTIPAATESATSTSTTNTATTGTCEGTDDKGTPCPATFDASKPCPRGCTSIPSASETEEAEETEVEFSWTTANDNQYMCPPVDGEADSPALVCAQGQYPEGTNFGGGASAVLTCPDGEVMACFVFASYGQVGGSCNGDPFMEDPGGVWEPLPTSVADDCIGQQSCTVTAADGSLNEVKTPKTAGTAQAKFKALVMCRPQDAGGSGTGVDESSPSPPRETTKPPQTPPEVTQPPSQAKTLQPSSPPQESTPTFTPGTFVQPIMPGQDMTEAPEPTMAPEGGDMQPDNPGESSTPKPTMVPLPPPTVPTDRNQPLPEDAILMVIKLTFGNLDVTEATDAVLNGIKSSIAEAARVPVGWVDAFDVVAGSTVMSFRVHFDPEDVEAKNNFEALVSADAPAIFEDDPALAGLGVEKQGVVESTDGNNTDDDGALVDPDQPGTDSGASVSAAIGICVLGAATAFAVSLG